MLGYDKLSKDTKPVRRRRVITGRTHHELITPPPLLTGTNLGPPEQYVIFLHPGAGAPDARVARTRGREGRYAGRIGEQLLRAGGMSLLDVAVEMVALMESAKLPNLIAAAGSGPNRDGEYEFDAFAAEGKGDFGPYGTVGAIEEDFKIDPLGLVVAHPVHVARIIQEQQENFISGKGATNLAKKHELPFETHEFYDTVYSKNMEYSNGIYGHPDTPPPSCDTVGAIVAARYNGIWTIAGAGSTGGMPNKSPGRIGDTATNGAGFRFMEATREKRFDVHWHSTSHTGKYYNLNNRVVGALVSGFGEASLSSLPAETWCNAQFNSSLSSDRAIENLRRTKFGNEIGWGAMIGLSVNRHTTYPGKQVLYEERANHIAQDVYLQVLSLVPYFPVTIFTNVPNARLNYITFDRDQKRVFPRTRQLAVPYTYTAA